MSVKKDMKKLLQDVERAGFSVEDTRGGHAVIKGDPFGKRQPPIYCPKTPSEYRSLENLKSLLRKSGYEADPARRKKKGAK